MSTFSGEATLTFYFSIPSQWRSARKEFASLGADSSFKGSPPFWEIGRGQVLGLMYRKPIRKSQKFGGKHQALPTCFKMCYAVLIELLFSNLIKDEMTDYVLISHILSIVRY